MYAEWGICSEPEPCRASSQVFNKFKETTEVLGSLIVARRLKFSASGRYLIFAHLFQLGYGIFVLSHCDST